MKAAIALMVVGALVAGCSSEGDQNQGQDHASHSDTHGDGGTHASADPADKTNAVCPVMGGEVDPDIYVEYRGKKVLFCCGGCVGEFEKNPERFFAKAYPDGK